MALIRVGFFYVEGVWQFCWNFSLSVYWFWWVFSTFSISSKHYFVYLVFRFRLLTIWHDYLIIQCLESFTLEKSYYWSFAHDVIKNMIMQIMINLLQIVVWPLRLYNVSLPNLWPMKTELRAKEVGEFSIRFYNTPYKLNPISPYKTDLKIVIEYSFVQTGFQIPGFWPAGQHKLKCWWKRSLRLLCCLKSYTNSVMATYNQIVKCKCS